MMIRKGPLPPSDLLKIQQARKLGFDWAVVRATNYGIREPGAVESLFFQSSDAVREAQRLSLMYPDAPDGGKGFVVLDLRRLEQSGVAP